LIKPSKKLKTSIKECHWQVNFTTKPKISTFCKYATKSIYILFVLSFEIWSVQVEKTRLENSWRSFAVEKAYLEDIYYSGRPDFRETYYERSDILF